VITGAVFSVGLSLAGLTAAPVVPLASDKIPATPNAVTALFRVPRFEACFVRIKETSLGSPTMTPLGQPRGCRTVPMCDARRGYAVPPLALRAAVSPVSSLACRPPTCLSLVIDVRECLPVAIPHDKASGGGKRRAVKSAAIYDRDWRGLPVDDGTFNVSSFQCAPNPPQPRA
jgi:hypothetical protein